MSRAFGDSQLSVPDSQSDLSPPTPSFVESFFNSFFQEKNIKWMLVVGAAIVFGSSLMLVTKAWPEWSLALKYLTILGYTGAIFAAAEITRKRLKLQATHTVLHVLTLLLLPVSFLSLTWLTSGTAVQDSLLSLKHLVLLVPAVALMWVAAKTILDHWLRGRQTTFLISFCLLCVAGVVPAISNPSAAFIFIAASWLVFTAGVVKVNRHTFWLAEQHQLPRIFGFLPIMMLGLQFVVLVSVKAISAIPLPWVGFCVVLVSATVLVTARAVADVFKRRTGDLVRPLPWPIVVPMFCGIVLALLGLVLSAFGFSFVGETTYAIVPASILVAALFGMIAKDTKHKAFTWICLFAVAIAYQCSPTLFADWVQAAKSATADAINQPRVPLTMYGLTYLPLLSILAFAVRFFAKRNLPAFSRPIKRFVTVIAVGLFAIATTDLATLSFTSPFMVAAANTIAFTVFAVLFADRRYVLVSLTALVMTCGISIPALNEMGYTNLDTAWIPTGLAGMALLMAASGLPDRLLNRIAICGGESLMRNDAGNDRKFVQMTGCGIAAMTAIHWIATTAMAFHQPLPLAAWIQFGLLLAALVRYTLCHPHYLTAAGVWGVAGYAGIRWATGLDFGTSEMVALGTWGLIGVSAASYVLSAVLRSKGGFQSINAFRESIGFDLRQLRRAGNTATDHFALQKLGVFVVSLFDLSVLCLLSLIAVFHSTAVITQHAHLLFPNANAIWVLGWSSYAAVAWLFVAAWARRSALLGGFAAMILPLTVTSTMVSMGVLTGVAEALLVWAVVQSGLVLACHAIVRRDALSPAFIGMQKTGHFWLGCLMAVACLSFDWPMRIVAGVSLVTLIAVSKRGLSLTSRTNVAILASVNAMLCAAAAGGCKGWVFLNAANLLNGHSLSLLFMTGSLCVILFEIPNRMIELERACRWTSALRWGSIPLIAYSIFDGRFDGVSIIVTSIGFVVLCIAEATQAIRQKGELRVWTMIAYIGALVGFLFSHDVITVGAGISQIVMLTLSVVALIISEGHRRYERLAVFRRPMLIIGLALPVVIACLAMLREFGVWHSSSKAINALAMLMAAGIYFHQAIIMGRQKFFFPGLVICNAGLFLLWQKLGWNAPELYMVPVGISILGITEVMKKEIPGNARTPLQYVGLLTILCSPVLQVLGGSWAHILSLMLLSVIVILFAIGLRIRALVYTGTAFLMMDLVAMVIRSTIHNLNLLWVCGVVLGVAVIALAAFCENHREKLLARIRLVSAELATWN